MSDCDTDLAAREAQRALIWQTLQRVCDPEIPVVTIQELGILRDVRETDDGGFEVVITPTYSGCPAMGQIEDDVTRALQPLQLNIRVITQLAPPWTTDWITDQAREKLRAFGIAPPTGQVGVAAAGVVQFSRKSRQTAAVVCPQCGAIDTTEISVFGSTACKSQYRCLACLEPFDYFKPY